MTVLDYLDGVNENLELQDELDRLREKYEELREDYTIAEDRIAELENPWISVEDGMPDVNQLVLVYADLDNKTAYCTTDYIGQNGTWTGSFYVTHWCYLPKAPRSDTE